MTAKLEKPTQAEPSLEDIMRQRHPDWQHSPIEKQEELVVE